MIEYVYDIESYPNVFTITIIRANDGFEWVYEISDRVHHGGDLFLFMQTLQMQGHSCRMIGYNNIAYDYPLLHYIVQLGCRLSAYEIYQKSMEIITSNDPFEHTVWPSDWLVPQLDLLKINHFDNNAKRTSLKLLEFNMRSETIEDLPFEVGTSLTWNEVDVLRQYNKKDVMETLKFLNECRDAISTRERLTEQFGIDFMNANDTKIGADYFAHRLEAEVPGSCYDRSSGRKVVRGTHRDVIHLKDAVLPYIEFYQPGFAHIKNWLEQQSISETKGVFKGLSCNVMGFDFHFGVGGIHGSVESETVVSDDEWVIIDLDVASYYPNLAIANRFYPEHLSETFCDVYHDVYLQRKEYPKKTVENALFKLALNGVYGKSNSHYSPFYDPLYMLKITINGQLLLCMLAEWLFRIPGLRLIQINTDGLTVKVRRREASIVDRAARRWEEFTGLTLERADYNRMFIRDVNNYLAEYTDGSLKRKGAYEYEDLEWHKNHSQLVVAKAAEAALLHGEDIMSFLLNHDDFYDFCLRAKVNRSDILELDGRPVQRITRYYVSTTGGELIKRSPPPKGCRVGDYKRKNGLSAGYYYDVLQELANTHGPDNIPWDERIHTKNKSTHQERVTGISKGWKVTECNDIMNAINPINYEYYRQEVEKLVKPLL